MKKEVTYKGLKVISREQFNSMNNVCISLPNDNETCTDDIEVYLENITLDVEGGMIAVAEEASRIEVMKKDTVHISKEWLDDVICEYIYDSYNMDCYSYIYGRELIGKFTEDFNKQQSFYQSGETIAYLDLSLDVVEYCNTPKGGIL